MYSKLSNGPGFQNTEKDRLGSGGVRVPGSPFTGAKKWPTSSQTHLAPCPCLAQNAYNSRDYLRVKGP